ncbi:Putative HAD superfamily protein [Septoria linicola]|uniref:HAD superfamily protein n=1 Tax=Septoria linicola TaxID=215465 RepID=A0A9Q9B3P9_9PEZI|nr:Putative HAD superfamily protein [Septoria linicola]
MPPRNLLICFDAFGTLFKPRYPIAQQYGDVARSFGLSGFTNDDVASSFKAAFKKESRANPNYGKANGLNAEKWWTNIITNTFTPIIAPDQAIPNGMVPKLLHRFWCNEGYTLFEDVQPLVRKLREAHKAEKSRVVIGVITNSDDRVPDILTSFDLKVSPLRYGDHQKSSNFSKGEYDIDFSIMSYDVGHEKPDKRIFEVAEEVLSTAFQNAGDASQWRKVYVGDEYDKDVVGAVNAGWNAILVDRETAGKRDNLVWLDEKPIGSLYEVFESARAVGFSSMEKLAQWLPSGSKP